MKKIFTTITVAAFSMILIIACTKESGTVGTSMTPSHTPATQVGSGTGARPSGSGYSQSIPVDTANSMITSYLSSVGYPTMDTAIRSLSFDADTLRAYLSNPNIVTMKFMIGHQQAYINSGKRGVASGMRPDGITLIMVGLNTSDQVVRNRQNGVYDHMVLCPYECPTSSGATIE